ncbi:hypothetical protein BKA69DRAFT_1091838 [Paraphysoderma sedebokerense]|nr:hypothetical protein BKA69DRAFT_1091838 [Paraphysoderma sedebokerense]
MFVAGGVNLAVGLNRLALFERLMNRHMKALVRTLQFATPVLVGLYTITAICRMILVSAGPDTMAYFDIITTISIALFGITVFFHVFTDMSIVYFVLQKKFGMQRNDEDFVKEVKITIGILMVNIVVLFAAVILDTMHFSTKVAMGTVECMLQVYFIGNIYCLRKVKKIGTKSTGSSFESRMKRSLSQKKPSIAPEGSVTTQHTRGSCDLGTSDGRRQKKYSIAAESINSGPRETCELGSSDAKKQLENCKDSSHCGI